MQLLPIGRQNLERLRYFDCLYIDKTMYAEQIMQYGGSFFLSRPRRFGKSLFLSTLMELAKGNRALFANTHVDKTWNWERKYPVIHLSFAVMSFQGLGLERGILEELKLCAAEDNFHLETDNAKFYFKSLILHLFKTQGKVVILLDEYDKPLLEYIESHEQEKAEVNRKIMKEFYSVLKDCEPYLHLTFITGVTKFAQVSIFSDLNHLKDITFNENFATAFGYTQQEVEDNFTPYLEAFLRKHKEFTLDSLLPKIKEWYNGFSWNGRDTVYNPFGLLVFFDEQRFVNSWFGTGTPTFLIKSILDGRIFQFENTTINLSNTNFRSFKQLDTKILMLQAGYLTLKSLDVNNKAVLDYPNNEIRDSMYCYLLDEIHGTNAVETVPITDLAVAFREKNLLKIERIIKHVFDDLPYDVYTHQSLKQTEGFFHGIVHILFKYLGVYAKSEVHTTEGRADSVVETDTHVFIFEFKIDKTAAAALQQIKTNNYVSKYKNSLDTSGFGVKTIVCIGVNFNTKNRLMDDFLVEEVGSF